MLTDEDLVRVMMWRKESKGRNNAEEAEAGGASKAVESELDLSSDAVDGTQP